ncbi:acetyltransferase [Xylaria palmicola]|nr:acetyltransferase [Xylaria palmicola]
MSARPNFHIRGLGEGPEDGQFILDAFDSTLAQLADIGSGGQWGSQPVSERPNFEDRIKVYEQAKRYQATGEGDPILVFVIEAEIPSANLDELPASVRVRTDDAGKRFLAVGTVMLSEGICPGYIRCQFDKEPIKKALDGTQDYIYLEALFTDHRTGPWRKGAGAALIEHSRKLCQERGQRVLYLDCYAGNERKLVKYYERQGFSAVDGFEGPKPDGSIWPGMVLRMDIPEL